MKTLFRRVERLHPLESEMIGTSKSRHSESTGIECIIVNGHVAAVVVKPHSRADSRAIGIARMHQHIVMKLCAADEHAHPVMARIDHEVVAKLAAKTLQRPGALVDHVMLRQDFFAVLAVKVKPLAPRAAIIVMQVIPDHMQIMAVHHAPKRSAAPSECYSWHRYRRR